MKISLKFLGAAGTVTGSKTLLSVNGGKYLIDCGLFQGLKDLRLLNWRDLPLSAESLSAVLLTHAHLDHSGYLPVLVNHGFQGKIFSTEPTKALCGLLLPDAAYLAEEDALFANKHGFAKHHPALPLFNAADAQKALGHFATVDWGEKIQLDDTTYARFIQAGHLIGAGIIQINASGRMVTFSGDLGRFRFHPLVRAPQAVENTDVLILESTYGDRRHPSEDPLESLRRVIVETHSRRGHLLIPSFAVGRAQQLLFLLNELKKKNSIPDMPVYVNSPMAAKATQLLFQFEAEHSLNRKQIEAMIGSARFASTVEESKRLNDPPKPSIIISASGMASGGRVLHHLKFMSPDPRNTILFAGFQAPGTRGEAIVRGAKTVKIHGDDIPIRANIVHLETLSGHADQEELLMWLKNFKKPPAMTFLNHGEPDAREALKKKIEDELRWQVALPHDLEEFVL